MSYGKSEMTTFKNLGRHNLNRKAVDIVFKTLATSMRMSDLEGQHASFDILWRQRKLCVRAARQSTVARFPRWVYMTGKIEKVDFFVLFAIKNEEIYKIFVLPASLAPEQTISISEHGDFIRYKMFETTLENLAEKIEEVEADLPKLEKIHKEAKIR